MIKLLELRSEKGISQREMAKIMNVSQGTYNNWENERTQPSIEQLIVLSDFFAVSVDYLIGKTDDYEVSEKTDYFSEEEKGLVRRYRRLNAEAKQSLLLFLKNV